MSTIRSCASRFTLKPNEKLVKIWIERRTCNRHCIITEQHAFRCGNITVWAGILLGNRTDLHIYRQSPVMAVRYRDEVLDPIVKLYGATIGPSLLLMDDNAHPHRDVIIDDFLESERIKHID